MQNLSMPPLGISRRPDVPQIFVDEFLAEVQRDNLRVDVREQGSGVFAGLEWLMETAVAVYIVRPYLDSMLSELGKDHYKILKRATVDLYGKMASLRISRFATPGKVTGAPVYSLAFSVVVATGEGINLKFLIQPELDESQASVAFESFFRFVVSMIDGTVTPETLEELERTRVVGKTLLLAHDFSLGRIIPVDPLAKIEPH
jgi:hypothetical protein